MEEEKVVAETIPFRSFKEQIKIVKEELDKGRFVRVEKDYIYSEVKGGSKNEKL